MAVDRIDGRPLRQVASFISSGTFTTPPGVNQLWVSVLGAAGSRGTDNVEGGAGKQIGGYVNTSPGQTHPVIIGARGARGQSYARYSGAEPTQGGTTSFGGALIASSGGIAGGAIGTGHKGASRQGCIDRSDAAIELNAAGIEIGIAEPAEAAASCRQAQR